MCAGAYFVTMQLARPGARLSSVFLGLLIALLFAWLFVMVSLVDISAVQRVDVLFSGSWRVCTLSIAALSLPIFVAAMWGLKQFAPTHPALCGAVAGLCAGAASVVIYSLHCPEMNIFFIGVWYVLGMCIPAVIGACLGRYLLRW